MPTPITHTDLSVINQALTGPMGEGRITNLETDQTTKAEVMRENYQPISEAAQIKTAWRFNTIKLALNKLSASPVNRWAAAWTLPADHLKTLTTWPPPRLPPR